MFQCKAIGETMKMINRVYVGVAMMARLVRFGSLRADPVSMRRVPRSLYPIYSKWFSEFKTEKNVEINYQSIGSGGGISQLTGGTIDFGASDKPLTDAQASKMKVKPLHFPTVLGAVVPTYNVPGVTKDLNFTGEALAGIFMGNIKKWNDPAIKNANPGVNLPGADIVVVHRSGRQWNQFCLHRFSFQSQPGVQDQSGALIPQSTGRPV